ncbi:MAG: hypothetical protein DCF25_15895 [Leptolyngbya foveolarum]|uniref:DUF6473 domain-containing protein n=1 Tax=Leptolyngbya foveolarum TaxID=47253 RepID=A0A2W4W389_9CYAN|nr:MAG: hypothetical protein DCF25_15895 [Leptolyngbya foveolarum]
MTSLKKPDLLASALGYQKSDAEIVDYNIWKLWTPQCGLAMRGPQPASLKPGEYCTSIGAAYTFGRFVAQPYPELLGKALNISSLNLGFSGVGPSFFNQPRHRALIELINRSKFATLSLLSGRSQSNSQFKTAWYSQEQYILENGKVVPADYAYQQLLDNSDRATVMALVEETRSRYLDEFIRLLEKITVPKVLLWFSKRSPDYEASGDTLFKLFGNFPHLINREMVEVLRLHCDDYVEYVDATGLPQQLISRLSQQPVAIERSRDYQAGKIQLARSQLTHNNYYPSPEMHIGVTQALTPVCKKFA